MPDYATTNNTSSLNTDYFREFVEGTDDMITQVNANGLFTYINQSGAKLLGRSIDECIGISAFSVIHPDDKEGTQLAFSRWIQNRIPSATFENRLVSRTGDIRYMLWTINLHYASDGTLATINSIARDITERKQAQAVEQERDFIAAVMETIHNLVVVCDDRGRIVRFNRASEQITGYTFEEAQGKQLWDLLLLPADVALVKAAFVKPKEHTFPNTHETVWVTKNGKQRLIAWSSTALLNDAGAPEYIIITGNDITERRQAEAALRQSEERFREFVEGTDAFITQVDADGNFTYVNRTAEKILGLPPEECIGLSAFDFIHVDDRAMTEKYFAGWVRNQAQSAEFENRQVSRQGAVHHMHWTINLHYDAAGNVTSINSIARDVTDHKRAEETIRVQAAALAELSTPLIPINDQLMVMPLIGSVDSRRAQQVMETLLEGIAANGAEIAIIDITGVPVVDTQVANALMRAAKAVKLLGAKVILTGIRPEVAQTLVGLDINMAEIVTRSNLQRGIAYAMGQSK